MEKKVMKYINMNIHRLGAAAVILIMILNMMPAVSFAESSDNIELGVPVYGSITDQEKPSFAYWSDLITKEENYNAGTTEYQGDCSIDIEWDERYSDEYILNVNQSGFYKLQLNCDDIDEDDDYDIFPLVLDDENVKASEDTYKGGIENDNNSFLYLKAGKVYRIIIIANKTVDFNFIVTYYGEQISSDILNMYGNPVGVGNARLSYTLDSDGILTISGEGNLENEKGSIWKPLVDVISEIKINEGITSIEYEQFCGLANVTKVSIPSTVNIIEPESFDECEKINQITFYGDAPKVQKAAYDEDGEYVEYAPIFNNITATAYYPAGNSTWTEAVMKDYGGNITWVPYSDFFVDVPQNAWYYDAVKYVYNKGIMSGTSEFKFSPNATTTRGMIVTILYRMEGEPEISESESFGDVSDSKYYANAVKWAASKGIVAGYENGTFKPENKIKREQLACILYNYASYKGYDLAAPADLSVYQDAKNISAYAKNAMGWAVASGMITGTDRNIIAPMGNATRAQVAQIFMNFCENVASN
jgi:hypothetical protein